MDKQARDKALEKVRKLLSMAGDGRGNTHEAEAAARQAAKLMQQYNIDTAEAQLADLGSDTPDLMSDTVIASYDPGARPPKEVPTWLSVLAAGVAQMTQTKADLAWSGSHKGVRFAGFSTDVIFARWLYEMLSSAIFMQARREFGHAGRREREDFRYGAASQLQKRLKQIRAEQDAELRSGGAASSTALVVVDKKLAVINEHFGNIRYNKTSKSVSDKGALNAGREYGASINIPSGRPVNDSRVRGALK